VDGGSKMTIVKEDSVVNIIHSKIEDYEKILQDIMDSEETDKKLSVKYRHYIQCLTELQKELFHIENIIFETLRQNYEKYDTEFIFVDGSSYTVEKDEICSFQDNYVLIVDKEKYEADKVFITTKCINLDNVKLVKTLS